MVGFYTAQPGSVTLEEQGTDAIPSSAGDVQSAVAGMALAANPTPRIVRATLGGGLDTELRPAVDPRTAGSDVDAMAAERGAGPVMLSPEDANTRYGIKGALSFDKPVPEPVASALHDTKHNQIVRQDVIDRRTPGIITGWAGRGVTSLAMGLLDPVNLAAGLVPGFGEARIAGALGLDIAGSVAARTGVRALAGASGGAAGMAALEPVNYLLDQHEHNDWTMGEALRNVAFGAVLGGALHTGIGALGDRLSRPPREVVDAGQETQAMAKRGAVAQVAEGRPVGVASALDLVEANTARGQLEMFARRQAAIDRDIAALQERANVPGVLPAEVAEQRISQLREQSRQLSAEIEETLAGARVSAMDEPTRMRLAEIDAELTETIPRARRADLVRERELLTEGRGDVDLASADLETGRDLAQARGLQAALTRTQSELVAEEAAAAKIKAENEARLSEVEGQREATQRDLSTAEVLARSQQNILRAMTERTIRRYAAQIGVALDRSEIARIVDEIHGAQPGEAADIIAYHLNDLAKRSPLPGVAEAVPDGFERALAEGSDALTARETKATNELRDAATAGNDDGVTARENAAMVERAPKVEDKPDADIQEAQRVADETTATIQAEIAAGRLTEEHLAPLREAEARFADEDAIARAMEEAAMCMRLS